MPDSVLLRQAKKKAYALLGLPPTVRKEEVRASYRRLAKEYHPDRNASPGAAHYFKTCTAAYKFLMNGATGLEGSGGLESMSESNARSGSTKVKQATTDEWLHDTAYGKWWFDRFGDV